MRALVWIVEDTWEATVARAAALLPPDAEVTLLHVAPVGVEGLAEGARHGLLGRRHPPPPHPVRAISDEAAAALLAEARAALGRDARIEQRRGRVEREVVALAADADLLVLARESTEPGPHSLRPPTRYVVDHAPCEVLIVMPRA